MYSTCTAKSVIHLAKHCVQRSTIPLILFLVLWLCVNSVSGLGEIIWAVNCGGDAHTDVHGVSYQADYLNVGTESDYGKTLMIQRVVPQDQILYQTERYHISTFGYEVSIEQDGQYVLVLKFSEVWFTEPNQKVFDVVINGEHTAVDELDIFSKVGRGVAHDEILAFSVKNGRLKVNGESSQLDGKLTIEFIKGDFDNPKVNAIYIYKGDLEDVPQLPPLPSLDTTPDEEEEDQSEQVPTSSKMRRPSGPKVQDPYSTDDTSTMMLPVVIAIGCFIPLLFCLCKL